jgi:hypothetical protein
MYGGAFNGVANYVDDGKLINFNDFFSLFDAVVIFRLLQALACNLQWCFCCCLLNYQYCKFVAAQRESERAHGERIVIKTNLMIDFFPLRPQT